MQKNEIIKKLVQKFRINNFDILLQMGINKKDFDSYYKMKIGEVFKRLSILEKQLSFLSTKKPIKPCLKKRQKQI